MPESWDREDIREVSEDSDTARRTDRLSVERNEGRTEQKQGIRLFKTLEKTASTLLVPNDTPGAIRGFSFNPRDTEMEALR